MQMTHVIINFRRHLKRRNFSPHTVKYYLSIIKQYVIWLDVPLEQATVEKIDVYIDYLHRKQMHPASINLYLVIIRVFYDYLRYEEKVALTNPVKRNRRLRVSGLFEGSKRERGSILFDGSDRRGKNTGIFGVCFGACPKASQASHHLCDSVYKHC